MSGQAHNKLDTNPLIFREGPTTLQSKVPQIPLVLPREKRCVRHSLEAK